MDPIILTGYISVKSALEGRSREVKRLIFDRERYGSVMKSTLRVPEKRQYESLAKFRVPTEYFGPQEFSALCRSNSAGGIAAEVGERVYSPLSELTARGKFLVLLEGIEDPYNLGFTLRTLYAAGADGVILPAREITGADDIVVRSSAGASELLKTHAAEDITAACRELKEKGFALVCADKSDKAKDLYKTRLQKPLCLVIGGEKRGISASVGALADITVRLKYPRDCHYSLTATNAAAIISFEVARRIAKPPYDVGNPARDKRFGNT